jgi:hypothetical protein
MINKTKLYSLLEGKPKASPVILLSIWFMALMEPESFQRVLLDSIKLGGFPPVLICATGFNSMYLSY